MENLSQLKKDNKKPLKSQAELKKNLESRFLALKFAINQEMEEYKKALREGVFEDKDGEETGLGENRKEVMQEKLNVLVDRAEKMKVLLDDKKDLPQYAEEVSVKYKNETINLNLEQKIKEFIAFYQKTKVDIPPDFKEQIKEIWENNLAEIEKAIQKEGFDDMLIMPGTKDLPDLHNKMTEGYNVTWESDNFKQGGSFTNAKSQNVDKPRIVLVHKTQNLKDRLELASTLNIKGQDLKLEDILTLEDYLVFQKKYFEDTGKHLDEDGWTWLATKSGARLVCARWAPGAGRVTVGADALDFQHEALGARLSRSFF